MDIPVIMSVVMSIIVIIVVILSIRKTQCPVCGKYLAIKTTGRTNLEKDSENDSFYDSEKRTTKYYTNTYQSYLTHHKCSFCNHTFDVKERQLIDRKQKF